MLPCCCFLILSDRFFISSLISALEEDKHDGFVEVIVLIAVVAPDPDGEPADAGDRNVDTVLKMLSTVFDTLPKDDIDTIDGLSTVSVISLPALAEAADKVSLVLWCELYESS